MKQLDLLGMSADYKLQYVDLCPVVNTYAGAPAHVPWAAEIDMKESFIPLLMVQWSINTPAPDPQIFQVNNIFQGVEIFQVANGVVQHFPLNMYHSVIVNGSFVGDFNCDSILLKSGTYYARVDDPAFFVAQRCVFYYLVKNGTAF